MIQLQGKHEFSGNTCTHILHSPARVHFALCDKEMRKIAEKLQQFAHHMSVHSLNFVSLKACCVNILISCSVHIVTFITLVLFLASHSFDNFCIDL